ncbi:hypothetical protein KY289_012110 [Solanum tuberosum]|nr:hypothetical protein KY289_012110 [Solanum tuberosum]
MDDSTPSKRITRGSMEKSKQILEEKYIEELRSKKKMTQLHFQKSSTMSRQATLKLLKEKVRGKPKIVILRRLCLLH